MEKNYDKSELYNVIYESIINEILRCGHKIKIIEDEQNGLNYSIDKLFKSFFDNSLEGNGLEPI